MGLIKIIKQETLYKDSVDDFLSEQKNDENRQLQDLKDLEKHHKPGYSIFWGGVIFIALVLCLVCFVGYWMISSDFKDQTDRFSQSYLFEVKALSKDLKPIQGAKIFQNSKQIGITDKNGKWRRFIQILDKKIPKFFIRKNEIDKNFYGWVSFDLKTDYFPEKKEFKKQIILENKTKETREKLDLVQNDSAVLQVAPTTMEVKNSEKEALPKSSGDLFLEAAAFYQNIAFFVESEKNYDEPDAKKIRQLQTYVIPKLLQQAKSYDLSPSESANWQIKMIHLSEAKKSSDDLPGLIKVEMTTPFKDKNVSFLRNYTGSPDKTAEVILRGVKSHSPFPYWSHQDKKSSSWVVKQISNGRFWNLQEGDRLENLKGKIFEIYSSKDQLFEAKTEGENLCENPSCLVFSASSPYFAPKKDWGAYTVKIYGLDQKDLEVYISGIKANFLGEHAWKFWGTSEANMYLSIVQGKKVLARELIRPTEEGIVLTFPSPAVVTK